MANLSEREHIRLIRNAVGDGAVLCACSGGLDSTVTAMLVHRAVPPLAMYTFIDTGLLRANQWPYAQRLFEEIGIPLNYVDANAFFLLSLRRVVYPEAKRKVIGREFISIFEREALPMIKEVRGSIFLAQGTISADVIESRMGVKAQHNVGGLPDGMKLPLLEPLRQMDKSAVRVLAAELGLPSHLINREPVPGPGLAIRIVGEVTRDRLRVLREVDNYVLRFARSLGERPYWQVFPVLLPGVRSTGFYNSKRTYGYLVAIRAVGSMDGLTATVREMPWYRLTSLADAIVTGVPEVGRVVYDITDKPPATIEWE